MLYFIGWLYFLIRIRSRLSVRVIGRENVPPKGAFIFASNHASYLDPVLLGTSVYRPVSYMAKESLFNTPLKAWALKSVRVFPVKRNEGDPGAIKTAIRILRSGEPLVIFPEGTRSKDGRLQQGKPGIGFIVSKAKVPVVPAYIEGAFEAMPGGVDSVRRHPVTVYIGKPVSVDALAAGKADREAYQKISDGIMTAIARVKERQAAVSAGVRADFEEVAVG